MGGGSNLLVADAGLTEAVLRVVDEAPVCSLEFQADGSVHLAASAGTGLDAAACFAVEEGLEGLESASGIPGTVGGGVCGNAGAFGWQVGETAAAVQVLTREGGLRVVAGEDAGFGYRVSRFQQSGDVLLKAWFRVRPAVSRSALREKREEILALRREKHPDWRVQRTAGSFFKNLPPVAAGGRRVAAGGLLEAIGAKRMREGGAYVYEKHANILMAGEGATAADVDQLARRLADAVEGRFRVRLEREVRTWP
jgi:UDP-N-acetylmuramate dehydrogenase